MVELLLHSQTKVDIDNYLVGQGHALLISGPIGAGKLYVAQHVASQLLNKNVESLMNYPFYKHITTAANNIGINEVRQIHTFLKLKTTGQATVRRIIIVENAHLMSEEAQNSFLKILEEPPTDTVIIMTASHAQSILPTILSRVQQIEIKRPTLDQINNFYSSKTTESVNRAYQLSSGWPGMMSDILSDNQTNPLFTAIVMVKELLTAPVFERLLKVDEISRDKDQLNRLIFALKQVCKITIEKLADSKQGEDIKRWHNLYNQAYLAEKRLLNSASPKLVITDLFLQM
ncbi:MAG TPA: AAA family ATPase [Candidatus Saccharimonadales bacterium]|nr:AAA family ATPase [Candidatus Saccharimonadales bacterium]